MAQVDYFLKIDGVDGESTDDKHKGEIDLESFSWGETQAGTAGHGAGGGCGQGAAAGLPFREETRQGLPGSSSRARPASTSRAAILTARKAGGGQQEYLKVTMEDVLVSSYQVGGPAHGDVVPMDRSSLNFAKLEMSYKEQKPDGSLGGEAKQKYDFAANKKI